MSRTNRWRDWWEGVPAAVTGWNAAYRWLGPTRRRVVVLNWHHVSGEDFRRQLGFLLTRHVVVRLSEAVACAAGEASSPQRPHRIALTFDDAYESFLTGPYPVLREFGVPATLFVAPGLLGTVPFWYVAERALELSAAGSFEWRGRTWDNAPGRTRDKTAAGLVAELKPMYPAAERDAALAGLLDALGVGRERAEAGQPRVMSAEQVAGLDPTIVTVGAHTISHPALARIPAEARAAELSDGRRECERLAGRPVGDFAFPYGRGGDVDAACSAAAREAGFRSAFTTVKGDCGRGADPFALPRVDLVGHEGRFAVAVRAGGSTRWLKGLLR
jgi:peptidoglycan/xylan/chitin deacetylase (PgdA/CDA1 family)